MNMKNEPPECSVGEYLAPRLEQAEIRHYFTVPGDFNLVLLDQLLKNPRVELIGCCNELNAGYVNGGLLCSAEPTVAWTSGALPKIRDKQTLG
jgi:pyruvate decarboxylase